ncbi:MAG: hypothetical protein LPK19_05720, partial [Hymenobacteraceae bacterium]|nr:hypothetical protein [Hymenobacteraceae bacterium]MDX5395700.1 hypothetical protein [Hymenobacteraceae bacterium]MDX5511752.1 hypothetical protein [Hymenobacteraceae bacterium]
SANSNIRRKRRLELKQQEAKLKEQQSTMQAISLKLQELDKQLDETGQKRNELVSKGKALVSLFQGEYDLAKTALKTLTHHQISTITEEGLLQQNEF